MQQLRKGLSKFNISEWCFGLILILSIVYMCIICYCDTISGDEYFSAGFANNTKGFLFLTRSTLDEYGSNGWIDGDFLRDYLSVQDGEGFAILNIHRNVRDDVHPPLYFMLLNVLSSFFIDEIPYFAGFFINIICGVIICIILYMLGRKMFRNQWLALVAPIVWIGSEGARTTIVYLRMYAPLCALCLICIYLHVMFFEKEKASKWLYVSLAVCTMIGTLTHYYFYIMLIVVGFISTIRLFREKKHIKFILYALSHAGGWIISYVAYPYVFEHLLFSNRGTEVQDNLVNLDYDYYKVFLAEFMNTLDNAIYNNRFVSVISALLILVIILIFVNHARKKKRLHTETKGIFAREESKTEFILIGCYALGFFLIIFKISYSAQWLYISPIFALMSFVTVGIFAGVLEKLIKEKYSVILLFVCIVALFGSWNIRINQALNRLENREFRYNTITAYSNTCDVLFFYTEWNNLYNNQMQELMEFNQIYSINVNDLESSDYDTILAERETQQNIIVYIPIETVDYEMKAKLLAQKIGNGVAEKIFEDKFAVYYIDMR